MTQLIKDTFFQPLPFEQVFLERAAAIGLTEAEILVAREIIRNRSSNEIAEVISKSPGTIKTQISSILDKLPHPQPNRGSVARYLYYDVIEQQLLEKIGAAIDTP